MDIIAVIIISLGVMFGSVLLVQPIWGIWALIFAALLVGGSVEYFFTGASQVRWGITLLALVPLVSTFLSFVIKNSDSTKRFMPAVLLILIFIFVVAMISTVMNSHYLDAVLAAKNFFPYFSLPFAFYYVVKSEKTVRKIMFFMLFVAFIEVPVAFFQYFFYMTRTGFKGDLVTGTFGGSELAGGGPNDALSIFLLINIVTLLAFAKEKLIRNVTAILLAFVLVLPIFLTNAKIMVLLFVIAFVLLYAKDFLQNPLRAFGGLVLIGIFTSSIFYVYYTQGESYSTDTSSMNEYIVGSTSYVFSSEDHQLSRFSAITYWFEKHSLFSDPLATLFGHGLGAVRPDSGLGAGYIQRLSKYKSKMLGITALTTLLWELGVVGTVAYLYIFLVAFIVVTRLITKKTIPPVHRAFLKASQVAVVVFAIGIPYKLTIFSTQPYAVYVFTVLGYILFWQRRSDVPASQS